MNRLRVPSVKKKWLWAVPVMVVVGLLIGGLALAGAAPITQRRASPEESLLKGLRPDKQAFVDRMVREQQAAARIPPAPADRARAPTPPPVPRTGPPPRGIIEDGQAPLPSRQLRVLNQWQDVIDGQLIHVYAGRSEADPAHGVIVVLTPGRSGGTYVTPTATGGLRIIREEGQVFTLAAANGETWSFNLSDRGLVRG
jgi:hypothetical protein